jgi:antitoxin (DNA-binding transcriptional repressor) of toxin-antitoxin stability system
MPKEESLSRPLNIVEAAQILTKFSDLAKAVKEGKEVSLLIK